MENTRHLFINKYTLHIHTNYLFHKIHELSQVNKINFINKQKTTLVTSIPALNLLFKRAFSSKQYNKSRFEINLEFYWCLIREGGGGWEGGHI